MDTLRKELTEIVEKLKGSTPDSETLSKFDEFLREVREVEGVDEEVLAGFRSSLNDLILANRKYVSVMDMVKRRERYSSLMGITVPSRFSHASKSDFHADLWEKCVRASDGLYLAGKAGTGKTHLAVALLRHYAEQKPRIIYAKEIAEFHYIVPKRPMFASIPEVLLEIRASFNRASEADLTESDIIRRYTEDNLVVFDDLGAEKSSEWSIQTLYTIIDLRYREMQKTIFTSNLSLDEVSDKLGDRIASRIAGMCSVITLSGKDRRVRK